MDERKLATGYGIPGIVRDMPASTEPQVQTALKSLCAAVELIEQTISSIENRFSSVLRVVPEGVNAKLSPDNQVELASMIHRQASYLTEQVARLRSIHDRCEL